MASKTSVKVFIGGRLITLAGYEKEEYLQKIASYLNHKIASLEEVGGYNRMTPDLKSALLELNIADDFFKARTQVENLEEELENREHDSYAVKQDLVAAQIESEKLKKEIENLNKQIDKLKSDNENLKSRVGYRR